jgi:hypothetical protein
MPSIRRRRGEGKSLNSQLSSLNFRRAARGGYVFLITVLLVGAIAIAVVTSLLFLATNTARSALTLQQSSLSHSYAVSCAELALRSLRTSANYAGDETVSMPHGTCKIYDVQGSGYENLAVCVEGVSGSTTRRMELTVASVLPSVSVSSWQEVPVITLCPTT